MVKFCEGDIKVVNLSDDDGGSTGGGGGGGSGGKKKKSCEFIRVSQ